MSFNIDVQVGLQALQKQKRSKNFKHDLYQFLLKEQRFGE